MKNQPLKLCWIDPIATNETEKGMVDLIQSIKNPETYVEVVTLPSKLKVDHLEYHSYEALVTGSIIEITRDLSIQGFDGAIIGCFYDLALEEALEISGDMIMTAPCQASLQVLSNLCNRFSIIVGRQKHIHKMHRNVVNYGYANQLTSFRSLDMCVNDFQADHSQTEERIQQQVKKAIVEDFAEAIVLGCTMEYGFYEQLQEIFQIPVIDPVIAAFKVCEFQANLKKQFNWKPSRAWSCEPPPEKELKKFGIFNSPPPLGCKTQLS